LRAYSYVIYILDQSIKRGDKFALRAFKGKLISYKVGSHTIYRIYMLSLYKVIRLVNVLFNKDCFDLNKVNKEGVAPNTEL